MTNDRYYYVNENGYIHCNTDYGGRREWFLSAMGNMFDSVVEAAENIENMKELWEALKKKRVKIVQSTNDENVLKLLKSAEQFMGKLP